MQPKYTEDGGAVWSEERLCEMSWVSQTSPVREAGPEDRHEACDRRRGAPAGLATASALARSALHRSDRSGVTGSSCRRCSPPRRFAWLRTGRSASPLRNRVRQSGVRRGPIDQRVAFMTTPAPTFECLRRTSWHGAPARRATFRSFAALDHSRANLNLVTVPLRTRADSRLVCHLEEPSRASTNTATKLTETRCGKNCLTRMVIADVWPTARVGLGCL